MLQRIHLRAIVVVGSLMTCAALGPPRHASAEDAKRGASRPPTTAPATQPVAAAQVKIDLNKALAIKLPAMAAELKAEAFTTPDGKAGWAVRVPGGRPLATPAYADGRIFVGGGYGSHEFYAFDADTGQVAWKLTTGDDGPTGAVVEDGCVAFNTESCTVIIADARTGKLLWQQWLGDPLMSQPAVAKGRLYIAYPGGAPRGVQHENGAAPAPGAQAPGAQAPGAQAPAAGVNVPPIVIGNVNVAPAAGGNFAVGPAKGNGHRLLCADLKSGEHIWEQDITADVISAPVLEGDQVFLTCFDGTSFCLNAKDGTVVWTRKNAGTSAPLVADGQVIVTEKKVDGDKVEEGVRRLDVAKGEARDATLLASGGAEYLKQGRAGNVALQPVAQHAADAGVGFASAPASAGLFAATANVNVSTVVAGWSYQGARAAYAGGNILNAQGNRFNCVRSKDGHVTWQAEVTGERADANTQMFSPPALGHRNLYVCGAAGHMLSLRQDDGAPGFTYATGLPMVFQPALARGNVYATTANGVVICLKTGDADADGWTAWGGNAQHNADPTRKVAGQ